MSNKQSLLQVAQIGRLVGIKGELKLHDHSDFPNQFSKGRIFQTSQDFTLEIQNYNPKRNLVLFKGYENREDAACLVNTLLYSTLEETEEQCALGEDELFWFDVIGMEVLQDDLLLGVVKDIERIGSVDYMRIDTADKLVQQNMSKEFYIPFIEQYVQEANKDEKCVHVRDALGILESS